MERPSYSTDLALNDLWPLPKIKLALKERRFQDFEDIKKNLTTALRTIPQQESQKNVSNSGSIVGLNAQLSRGLL
jgi:hypothetical protein